MNITCLLPKSCQVYTEWRMPSHCPQKWGGIRPEGRGAPPARSWPRNFLFWFPKRGWRPGPVPEEDDKDWYWRFIDQHIHKKYVFVIFFSIMIWLIPKTLPPLLPCSRTQTEMSSPTPSLFRVQFLTAAVVTKLISQPTKTKKVDLKVVGNVSQTFKFNLSPINFSICSPEFTTQIHDVE